MSTEHIIDTMSTENKVVAIDSENPRKRKERRVGIQLIEDRGELNTTFTKRRQGLFKKIMTFCEIFNAQVGVIAFSKSGNLYLHGDPEIDPLLKRYLADPSSSVAMEGAITLFDGSGIPEKPALTDVENIIDETLGKGRPAWDMILENLDFNQLEEIEKAVKLRKTKIAAPARDD